MTLVFSGLVDAFTARTQGTITTGEFLATLHQHVLYFVYLAIGMATACYSQMVCWNLSSERQTTVIRKLYLQSILRQSRAFFDTHNTGELSSRLTADIELIQNGTSEKVGLFIQALFTLFTAIIISLKQSWRVTLVLACIFPFMGAWSVVCNRWAGKSGIAALRAYAKAYDVVEETLSAIRTVMSLGGQARASRAFAARLAPAQAFAVRRAKAQGMSTAGVQASMYFSYTIAFVYGSYLITKGLLTSGQLLGVWFALMIGTLRMSGVAPELAAFSNACSAAHAVFDLIDRKAEHVGPLDGSPTVTAKVDTNKPIRFENVTFSYPARQSVNVLENFSLEFESGKTTALVGKSGSGKSTIISMIERWYEPSSGLVTIDGMPVRNMDIHYWRNQIGLVSQEPILFDLTIEENIALGGAEGAPAPTREQIVRAATLANAHTFIENLPLGYQTVVGEKGASLSGGQRQRVCIARALVRDPPILLLDEATSALDSSSERLVQEALDRAADGRTTIVVAHRLSTVRNAHKIVVMNSGKIVQQGDHRSLGEIDGPYKTLVETQMIDAAKKQQQQQPQSESKSEKPKIAEYHDHDVMTVRTEPAAQEGEQPQRPTLLKRLSSSTSRVSRMKQTEDQLQQPTILKRLSSGMFRVSGGKKQEDEQAPRPSMLKRLSSGLSHVSSMKEEEEEEHEQTPHPTMLKRRLSSGLSLDPSTKEKNEQQPPRPKMSKRLSSGMTNVSSNKKLDKQPQLPHIPHISSKKHSDIEKACFADLESDPESEQFYKRLFELHKPETKMVVIGTIGAIMAGAVFPAYAVCYGFILQVFTITDLDEMRRQANGWAAGFLVIAAVAGVGNFCARGLFGIIAERVTNRVRTRAFDAMLSQEPGWFDRGENRTGVLVANIATDTARINLLVGTVLGTMVQLFTNIVGGIVVAFIASWKVTIICIVVVPLLIFSGAMQAMALKGFGAKTAEAHMNAARVAHQAIAHHSTVITLGREATFLEKYDKALRVPEAAAHRQAFVSGLGYAIASGLGLLCNALAFYVGGTIQARDEIDIRQFFTVLMACVFGSMASGRASGFAPDVAKAKEAARRLFALLDRQTQIDVAAAGVRLNRDADTPLTIEFRNVGFTYPTRQDHPVLKNLNLTIEQGQCVALVGPSGGGKSTLIALLERFYDPTSGSVRVNGEPLSSLDLRDWREQVGYVGQEPVLFDATIRENIAYGSVAARNAAVSCGDTLPVAEYDIIRAAKDANAHDFIMALPQQYDTPVGARATLSGGERQRLSIARALLRNARLLLLDEATSALDSESERLVQEALSRLLVGRTSVMIAHRLSTIQTADKIVVIEAGRVAETGTHAELVALGGTYATLVGLQSLNT
ncbi:hypothetical protein HDU86_002214 [Geranomyces michiganensis]|nr:hypothetical protein HDU86_002214 [Geranomyces michiganensis]